MISNNLVIFILLHLLGSINKSKYVNAANDPPPDDLSYYTKLMVTANFFELSFQDDQDAKDIINSGYDAVVIASIIPFREKVRRMTINKRIGGLTGVPYIGDKYYVKAAIDNTLVYKDLVFGLVGDELRVINMYMDYALMTKDETIISICLVLTKDIPRMRNIFYERYFWYRFDEQVLDDQRKPYRNMLYVWLYSNHEPTEEGELCNQDVVNDANALKKENEDGGWHEDRDVIEKILMKKSIKYGKAVIAEFEKPPCTKPLEQIIQDNVKAEDLNHDLADAYAFSTRYIKNKHKFIADKLGDFCDGSDQWTVWILSIAVLDPKEWPKVNEEFKKNQNGKSLSQFIMEKLTANKLFAETIAVVVDPSFKPTQFTEKPVKKELTKPFEPPVTFPNAQPPSMKAPPSSPPGGGRAAHG